MSEEQREALGTTESRRSPGTAERLELRRSRLIPLADYLEDLRAALLVGDEVTWSLLLRNYRVCDHGAQLITDLSCRHETLGGLRPW